MMGRWANVVEAENVCKTIDDRFFLFDGALLTASVCFSRWNPPYLPPSLTRDIYLSLTGIIPGYRGQQGARDGEAVHVLRSAGPSPLAAVAQGAHWMRGTQAAFAPLPPGEIGKGMYDKYHSDQEYRPQWMFTRDGIRENEPSREQLVREIDACRFTFKPIGRTYSTCRWCNTR